MVSRLRILLIDVGLVCLATVLALLLRENLTVDAEKLVDLGPYVACCIAVAVPVNLMLGLDRSLWKFTDIPDYARVALAACVTVFGGTVLMFLFNRMDGVSRSIPPLQALLAIFAMVGVRLLVRAWHKGEAGQDAACPLLPVETNMRSESVLLVGINRLSMMLLNQIGELSEGRVHVGGLVATDRSASGRSLGGHRVFGPDESLDAVLRKLALHGVAIRRILTTVAPGELPRELDLYKTAAQHAIKVENARQILDLLRPADGPERTDEPAPQPGPLHRLRFTPEQIRTILDRPYWRRKRVLDTACAGALLVVLSPVLATLALLMRLSHGSPVYFWQVRTGYNGRPVRLFKFRTMSNPDGDASPADDHLRQNAVGRFMRATRLDELPQLWNVLVGEMSFVGPRPLLPADLMEGATVRWLARPGLTGWAQVMGGRDLEVADKMALDMWYVLNASFRLDVEIALRTIPMLIRGESIDCDAIDRAWDDLRAASAPAVAAEPGPAVRGECSRAPALVEDSARP